MDASQFVRRYRGRHSCGRTDGGHDWDCVTWFPGLGQTEDHVRSIAQRLAEAERALETRHG